MHRDLALPSPTLPTNPHQRNPFHRTNQAEAAGTLLDTLETNVRAFAQEENAPHCDPQMEVTFRHAGWDSDRRHTLHALETALYAPARLHRFQVCGEHAWVQYAADDPGRYRVTCNKCKDRWCVPCQHELRIKLARNLTDQLPEGRLRFVTLTIRSTAAPLRDQIDRLYSCFVRWRRRKPIRECLTGGIFFLELTRSETSGFWHPHLHLIVSGHYLPLVVARKEWHNVTGDSFILDVRELKNKATAVGYVTKYAGKLVKSGYRRDTAVMVEVIKACEGRRTFGTFGTWRKMKLTAPKPSEHSWVTLCSLNTLISLQWTGSEEAAVVLATLRGTVAEIESADAEDFTDGAGP